MKPSVVKKMVPKKKQYTPSNAGYSHFAWYSTSS
jgi:hypothetical protein